MTNEEMLQDILLMVKERSLGKAVRSLETYLFTFPNQQAAEQLRELQTEYGLMQDYWRKGYEDPQRDRLYDGLLRRMFALTTNVLIRSHIRNRSFVMGVYSRARQNRKDWSVSALREDLENFVAEVAMLELEPPHKRQEKARTVYIEHQHLMNDLFDYIWTSRSWSEPLANCFEDMLLTPTIDSQDQQLMVSAITISLLNNFDAAKLKVLLNVYEQSADERVRQRALVGWAFCMDDRWMGLFPEIVEQVKRMAEDESCCRELAELQMQVFYCLSAEDDTQKIQQEIMPDLLKNNNFRITENGVEEIEDPLQDILHPEESERNIEIVEQRMRQMAEMQRQGADIYFGGFSQMKRFPFFNEISNWFVPYNPQHPSIAGILNRTKGKRFLRLMMENGPFCDSDKYSFVLAFEKAVERLPESLVQMLERGELTMAGAEVSGTDWDNPAYIRRTYLQNLYRFFKVFPMRSEFRTPFGNVQNYLFEANGVFLETRLVEKTVELLMFLIKRKRAEAVDMMLSVIPEEKQNYQYHMLQGNWLLQKSKGVSYLAEDCFRQALLLSPDDERAMAGLAKASFRNGHYEEARSLYEKLLERHPEKYSYELNLTVCLVNLGLYDEALKPLYKMNYEMADDRNVKRVLAWALVGVHKYEQASQIYTELLNTEEPLPDDVQNYSFCLWFSGDILGAVGMFRRYVEMTGQEGNESEVIRRENLLLEQHGITPTEVQLMVDSLTG